MIEFCYFSIDRVELKVHLLWRTCQEASRELSKWSGTKTDRYLWATTSHGMSWHGNMPSIFWKTFMTFKTNRIFKTKKTCRNGNLLSMERFANFKIFKRANLVYLYNLHIFWYSKPAWKVLVKGHLLRCSFVSNCPSSMEMGKRDEKNIKKNIKEKKYRRKKYRRKNIKGPLLTSPLFHSHMSPQEVLTRNLIQPQIRFELKWQK